MKQLKLEQSAHTVRIGKQPGVCKSSPLKQHFVVCGNSNKSHIN
jgi:hypothetical protein